MLTKLKTIFFSYKFILVFLVLLLALYLRIEAHNKMPLQKTSIYAHYYEPALFYMSGKGMNIAKGGNPEIRKKIDDFLYLRADSLDKNILDLYVDNPKVRYQKKDKVIATFGYYVAAYVWKIFGISWSSLFYFYAFISSLGCLALFFITKKITHSYLAGLFTAIVYACAVPEIYGAAWSIRNVAPVWFFIFSLLFLFLFTGIYKNKWFNYLSYFLLGAVTIIGIGWRSDPLLFFPFIAIVLFFMLLIKRKKGFLSFKDIIIAIVLFLLGTLTVLNLHSSLKPKSQSSLNFMHIAKFGGFTRSLKSSYENNFQNQFNDSVTWRHVHYYNKYTYPEQENPLPYEGQYGKYALELYLKALEHNIYQWVKSYPKYFYEVFIKKDLAQSNQGNKPNKIVQFIWEASVYIAIIGGIILFYIGVWRFEVSVLLGFTFYYSLIYWSILPMIKHMMIMVVPISLLAGMTLYFLIKLFLDRSYGRDILKKFISINNIKILTITLVIMFSLYYVLLYSALKYSTIIKEEYINKIKTISVNAKTINESISNDRRELSLDLTGSEPVGLLVNFNTLGTEGVVFVKHNYKRGQFRPFKYGYKFSSNSAKQTLFTTCYTIGEQDKYTIDVKLPYNAIISEAKLIPLDNWNGVYYGTVYSDNYTSPGAQSLRGIKKKERILPSAREKALITKINIKEFIRKSNNFEFINGKVWNVKTKKAYIWSQLHEIIGLSNHYSHLSAIVKKDTLEPFKNLKIKVAYFDASDKLLYKSSEYFLKNIILDYDKEHYEIIFKSQIPLETKKFRLLFTAKKGKYKVPKNIDVYMWNIKIDKDEK